MTELRDWLLCKSKYQHEFSVSSEIESFGLEVYCPTLRKVTRPKHKSRAVTSIMPAYPGYLFVRHDGEADLRVMMRIKGFLGFVKFGDHVASISQREIDIIKDVEEHNLWDDFGVSQGDRVRVNAGVFEGFCGYVGSVGKSTVMLQIDGQPARIEMPPFLLTRVQA